MNNNLSSTVSTKRIAETSDLAINGARPAFEVPLHVGYPNIGSLDVFRDLMQDMMDRRWFTNNGPLVQQLEARLADYLGVRNCVAMCNGTIALEIAIRALGMSGEVIVPSWTFIATAHALSWQGITPVFADINPATHNLDPASVRRLITPRTTGIIGVHVWGRPAPVEELQEIADDHGLTLIFDAAHAFGCSHAGIKLGSFGNCEILSFHATKFFNTFEGGAVVTNDDNLAAKLRLMRNFGFSGFDNVIHPGTNGKMIEPCAAMGLANFASLADIVETNRKHYERYAQHFAAIPALKLIAYDDKQDNNYQYVVVEVMHASVTRDQLLSILQAENILARRYFWPGCHGMKPYRELYPLASFALPHTISTAGKVLVLPTGTGISADHIDVICSIIRVALA